MSIFIVKHADCMATKKWPTPFLDSTGYSEIKIESGDYSSMPQFAIGKGTAVYTGSRETKLPVGHVHGVADIDIDGVTLSKLQVRDGARCDISECHIPCGLDTTPPIMFRGQTNSGPITKTRGSVKNCTFDAEGTTLPDSDNVAILVGDGICEDITVTGNTFRDVGQAVQAIHRYPYSGGLIHSSFHNVPGLRIEDNTFVWTERRRNIDGAMKFRGMECVFAFKTGGSLEKPVIVRKNRILGLGPHLRDSNVTTGNPSSPAQALSCQGYTTDVQFIENVIANCSYGADLQPEWVYEFFPPNTRIYPAGHPQAGQAVPALTNPRIHFERNKWVNIQPVAAILPWQEKNGTVYGGSQTWSMKDEMYINCNRIFAQPQAPWLSPRVGGGVEVKL